MVALVVMVGARVCALPLHDVAETMRALPIERIDAAPPSVRGFAVVRGAPVPIVDLGRLMGGDLTNEGSSRFVSIKIGNRRAVVMVDKVVGIKEFDVSCVANLPPLLREASADAIRGITTQDADFVIVLDAARIVPDDIWRAVDAQRVAR